MSDRMNELNENELNQVAGGFSPLAPHDDMSDQGSSDKVEDSGSDRLRDQPLGSGPAGKVTEAPIRRQG